MYVVWDSGLFPLFSEAPSPTSLADLEKKFSKISFSNSQYEKCLKAKSSLKQIQDAHSQRSFN